MTYAVRHPHAHPGSARVGARTIRWPRNLVAIGLGGLLVSAWGGIVPYVGPLFGYHANGTGSWQWTFLNAMLYLVPGAVGVVVSLAIIARSRRGRLVARFSLAFAGLLLVACGAWFVVGPAAWPALGASGTVFAPAGAAAAFVNQVGYNLGVGVILAALGGMAMKASTGERELALPTEATGDLTADTVGGETAARREGTEMGPRVGDGFTSAEPAATSETGPVAARRERATPGQTTPTATQGTWPAAPQETGPETAATETDPAATTEPERPV